MNFATIILAGGRSLRMGANKALMPYKGRPLIQYSLDLAYSFTGEILISANNHDLDHLGFRVVKDLLPVKAPLAGIHAGLKASPTDWNLVLTCDMPNVTIGLIDRLIAALNENLRIVLPHHDGFVEPLCGFYHRNLIHLVETNIASGNLSLHDLPGAAPHLFVVMDDVPPEERALLFRNVNERKDLLD